jgi:putative resolvase
MFFYIKFNYLNLFCKSHNKEIEVVNNVDTDKEDIIQDFVSIITSYCAKIYGKRRSKRKTEQIVKELENDTLL